MNEHPSTLKVWISGGSVILEVSMGAAKVHTLLQTRDLSSTNFPSRKNLNSIWKEEYTRSRKHSEHFLQCPTPPCIQKSLQGKENTAWRCALKFPAYCSSWGVSVGTWCRGWGIPKEGQTKVWPTRVSQQQSQEASKASIGIDSPLYLQNLNCPTQQPLAKDLGGSLNVASPNWDVLCIQNTHQVSKT